MATLNENINTLKRTNDQIENMMDQARLNRQLGLLKMVRKDEIKLEAIEETEDELNVIEFEALGHGSVRAKLKEEATNG